MGWWQTGQGDDIIGDDPADLMMDTLAAIAEKYDKGNKPAISPVQMLDAVLAALKRNSKAILAAGQESSSLGLTMTLDDGTQLTSSSEPESDEALIQLFADGFKKIAAAYEASELNRKPRMSELLATLVFVLGSRPASYQYLTDQQPIAAIRPHHA